MSDHQHHDPGAAYTDLCRQLEALPPAIGQLERVLARSALPGSWRRLHFSAGEPRINDDAGPNALALAIYNPNAFRVYVGVGGGAAADAFPVPKQKLVVAPIQVNGDIEFLADENEIGAGGFIWRVRFPTPQPFAVHSLA